MITQMQHTCTMQVSIFLTLPHRAVVCQRVDIVMTSYVLVFIQHARHEGRS
jgi:hypothetical protein